MWKVRQWLELPKLSCLLVNVKSLLMRASYATVATP